jgi:hypothetical protein
MAQAKRDDSFTAAILVENDTTNVAEPVLKNNTSDGVYVHIVGNDVSSSGGTSIADDADFTAGTTEGTPAMGVYESSPTSVTDGDLGIVAIDENRNLKVNIAAGSSTGTEYNEDEATPATITGGAVMIERDDALATVTPIEGDWISLRGTAEGALWVQDFNSDAILADTAAIQTAVELIDNAISGNEMQVDVVAPLPAGTNTIGKVAPNEYELAGNTTHVKKYYTSAGAATDGVIWSPAAGKRWYVTDIFINVSAAATVTLEDDLVAGDDPVWKAELAANSGWSHSFTTPLFSGEDAADLLITTSAGNVYVTVTGYEI